ncbi:MAG: VIT domain-containing protein [Planctomycetota bacterium]
MRPIIALSLCLTLAGTLYGKRDVSQGSLVGGEKLDLEFPLERTDVKASVAAGVASVEVTQVFRNPYDKPIEAIYQFPLPHDAAVDDLSVRFGERTIRGVIKRRAEARAAYEEAKAKGQMASLLDQERPNVFTQSLANVLPGEKIHVIIHYFAPLAMSDGAFEFVFPMVVGPRYLPEGMDKQEAARLEPRHLAEGQRTAADIMVEVDLEAGLPIRDLLSKSHEIDVDKKGDTRSVVKLHPTDTIPNKDFCLKWKVAGERPEASLLARRGPEGGFFTLTVHPQAAPAAEEVMPRELIFLVDTSGSMNGEPLDKVKEAMKRCLAALDPRDAFGVMNFCDDVASLSPAPLTATAENVRKAVEYVEALHSGGGTSMLNGIRAALQFPVDAGRVRLVCLMTDGYIGNEAEILAEVQRSIGAGRLFSFGVGSSVNRYLLEELARVGRGDVQFVRQDEDSAMAVEKFARRIAKPCVTDLALDWGGLKVTDVYPSPIPDVFDGRPVVLYGRFEAPGEGTLTLRGRQGGREWTQQVSVDFPEEGGNPALSSMWARERIAELSRQQYAKPDEKLKEAITGLALEFRLLTEYTSFVAIEETKRTDEAGKTVIVPVELPEGVSDEFLSSNGVYDSMGVGGGSGGGGRYGGRFGGRGNLVARGGGSKASVSATMEALKWLQSKQDADGSWGGDLGTTGLVLLTYEGAGYTHLSREKVGTASASETVKKALRWLIGLQDADGWIGPKEDVLGHARAATALCEAYGMTNSVLLKDPAQKAIAALASARSVAGGWSRDGKGADDSTTTLWALLAMKSGEISGLTVPQAHLEAACDALVAQGGAPALLAHVLVKNDRKDPRLEDWAKSIVATLPSEAASDYESWHIATMALFQYDGPNSGGTQAHWKTWNQPLGKAIIKRQAKEGSYTTGNAAIDVDATAFATLTLEVYYRYANALGGK